MKVTQRLVIALILALVAASAVALFVGSASAATGATASVSPGSASVSTNTAYTLTVTAGTSTIGSANITVPSGFVDITELTVTQPTGQGWTATLKTGKSNYYIIFYGSTSGLTPGSSATITFDAKAAPVAENYKWVIGYNQNTTTTGSSVPQSATTTATVSTKISSLDDAILILAIAAGIAFLNTALNRFLINYFVGWEQYRVMQKEMNEYRKETMAAAKANDKKAMERLKKRQSQINNMQAKMLKPQMVQLGVSFLYIFIWILVLTPTYGATSMVFLPGIGPVSVVYWYPIGSFFLGILASRILGIMPIEP